MSKRMQNILELIEAICQNKHFKRFLWNVSNAIISELLIVLTNFILERKGSPNDVLLAAILYGILNSITKLLNNKYGGNKKTYSKM